VEELKLNTIVSELNMIVEIVEPCLCLSVFSFYGTTNNGEEHSIFWYHLTNVEDPRLLGMLHRNVHASILISI